jgi:DNA-binding transcriptional LysR family regulator
LTLKHLRFFLTVCQENSITKAAQKLYTSQPAVSLAIREMENYYNIKLFDRISHRLHLTAPGCVMRDYADSILHQFDEMEQVILQQTAHETLKVGNSVGSVLFTTLMKGFEETYPNIQANVITDHTSTITKQVISNEFDIGTIEGVAAYPELCSIPFAQDNMVIIAPPSHPLRSRTDLRLCDLINERFLLREQYSGARIVTDTVFQAHDITIQPYWESSASQVIIDAVCIGIGISVLPYSLVFPYINAGTLIMLPVSDAVFERPFSIIYRKNKYQTQAFKALYTYFISEAKRLERLCLPCIQ